jgi:hypothetical protein
MAMHPITFTKQHPAAVFTSMAAGMIFGPWVLGVIRQVTGVNVNLPAYRLSRQG